jgi:tight adherence protein B
MLISAWIILFALFTVILHSLIVALIFTSFLIPFGFTRIIKIIHQKHKQKFAEGLPDLLNILASALRSGLSLPQGLEAYSADTEGEVAREIRRSIAEIRVGTPIEEALSGVAERMNNEDLRWAVEALSIQREVGGSMATILTTTFETVKARDEIRREVKTLSAEGKLSAYVLIALPLGIFLFLFLSRREYVKVFWTDPAGIILLIIIGISLSIGWAWMKKIVEIKI